MHAFDETVQRRAKEAAQENAARKIETAKEAASAYATSVVRMPFPEAD